MVHTTLIFPWQWGFVVLYLNMHYNRILTYGCAINIIPGREASHEGILAKSFGKGYIGTQFGWTLTETSIRKGWTGLMRFTVREIDHDIKRNFWHNHVKKFPIAQKNLDLDYVYFTYSLFDCDVPKAYTSSCSIASHKNIMLVNATWQLTATSKKCL